MKKLLLSLGLLAGVMGANAEVKTVVYDFANNTYGLTRESDNAAGYIENGTKLTENDGTAVTLVKDAEKNGWRLWTDGLRVYKNSNAGMKISTTTGKITKVAFDMAKDKVISAVNGTTVSGKSFTFTADAKDLDLTFNVSNNGAIASMTLTIDTDGTGGGGGETPDVPDTPTEVKSVRETIALTDGTEFIVGYPLTIAFMNYSNIFAVDAAGDFIQVYAKGNTYKTNDVIPAGWTGTYKLYSGTTPEIEPVGSMPESTETKEYTPKVVKAADITVAMVNSVIAVKDVVLTEASPATKDNFTGTSEGVSLTLRNNYALESVAAGTYNMTLLVNVYKGDLQLYVINYDAKITESGVAAIEAENGEAEFFNLQGVKVAKPENGLYIKVQNGKASKVLVK